MVLENTGWSHSTAASSVAFFAMADLAVAGAVIVRKFAKTACWAMVALSLIYLVASTVFVPQLWLDPLGPLVKVLPGIVLAIVTRIALENR